MAPMRPSTDVEGFITVRKKTTAPIMGHKGQLAPISVQNNALQSYHTVLKEGIPPMDRICSQNIWGLNWANKQEDQIAENIEEAWCILGDFNAALYIEDRIGGTEVQLHEVQSLDDCSTKCELQEYTWTNKTIWARIDRAFVNAYWYSLFDFCQVIYMVNTLSDHNALVMDFSWCPKPRPTFHFCDIWVRDPGFLPLITSIYSQLSHKNPITKLKGLESTAMQSKGRLGGCPVIVLTAP
ncbi:hypothetical protein Cgig2_023909 [Carnegiea gigantea]|uniref:Uncharacterized protein n=1 Tax=Carnegiea gigantea TaxID=171969 RepID=A0A9Q1JK15_9CARY|nr:hypothetical protein Cgig2_023909 [Carnegiea gigantea]